MMPSANHQPPIRRDSRGQMLLVPWDDPAVIVRLTATQRGAR